MNDSIQSLWRPLRSVLTFNASNILPKEDTRTLSSVPLVSRLKRSSTVYTCYIYVYLIEVES